MLHADHQRDVAHQDQAFPGAFGRRLVDRFTQLELLLGAQLNAGRPQPRLCVGGKSHLVRRQLLRQYLSEVGAGGPSRRLYRAARPRTDGADTRQARTRTNLRHGSHPLYSLPRTSMMSYSENRRPPTTNVGMPSSSRTASTTPSTVSPSSASNNTTVRPSKDAAWPMPPVSSWMSASRSIWAATLYICSKALNCASWAMNSWSA